MIVCKITIQHRCSSSVMEIDVEWNSSPRCAGELFSEALLEATVREYARILGMDDVAVYSALMESIKETGRISIAPYEEMIK